MSAIFVTTSPGYDLHAAGDLSTPATRANFARAYELAGARLARAMRRDLCVMATDDESRAWTFRTRTPAKLRELRDEIWQTLHECVSPGARKGTYRVNQSAAQFAELGRRYRIAFDKAIAAPDED